MAKDRKNGNFRLFAAALFTAAGVYALFFAFYRYASPRTGKERRDNNMVYLLPLDPERQEDRRILKYIDEYDPASAVRSDGRGGFSAQWRSTVRKSPEVMPPAISQVKVDLPHPVRPVMPEREKPEDAGEREFFFPGQGEAPDSGNDSAPEGIQVWLNGHKLSGGFDKVKFPDGGGFFELLFVRSAASPRLWRLRECTAGMRMDLLEVLRRECEMILQRETAAEERSALFHIVYPEVRKDGGEGK